MDPVSNWKHSVSKKRNTNAREAHRAIANLTN
jgi:hypothetical protein